MNPTIELLKSHRSIRKFQNRRIPRELFEELHVLLGEHGEVLLAAKLLLQDLRSAVVSLSP